jgi:hypothetical protein
MQPEDDLMQPEDDAVLEQIRRAFPSVEIQADNAFAQWGRTYLDVEPYQRELKGKSWDQLDRSYIVRRTDALGFLGTHHLVAVLPVYLQALIELDLESPVPGTLTLILAPPGPGKDSGLGVKRFGALVEALTGPQRAAVAAVLRRFGEKYPESSLAQAARDALDAHWDAYLPADGK